MAVLYIGNAVKISYFGGPPCRMTSTRCARSCCYWRAGSSTSRRCPGYHPQPPPVQFQPAQKGLLARAGDGSAAARRDTGVPATEYYQALDRYVGNSVWDQRSNYLNRGAVLYTLMEVRATSPTVCPRPIKRRWAARRACRQTCRNAVSRPANSHRATYMSSCSNPSGIRAS